MNPDFSKKTIENLAKRAAYMCSNPDCRKHTVGPNKEEVNKTTIIGEAAHIYGARPNSKRYVEEMSDTARAEITNAIWLCRNCHKLIDTDEKRYTSKLLFEWREIHEEYIVSQLGNTPDLFLCEEQVKKLEPYMNYSPVIRRIIIDKPIGWEWRLTAELMRGLNESLFQRIRDLHDGLYLKEQEYINRDEILIWIGQKLADFSNSFSSITKLIERLNKSWGKPGEEGNLEEIHHITLLIRDYIEQILIYEEKIYFAIVPDEYRNIVNLLKNMLGFQVLKLSSIPEYLDEFLFIIERKKETDKKAIIEKYIIFEYPENFDKLLNEEIAKIKKLL